MGRLLQHFGDIVNLRHPSVLAAYAGRNDGDFCRRIGSLGTGMVTIGGISVDDAARRQSRLLNKRGRNEPIVEDLRSYLEEQIPLAQESGALVAVSIRSGTLKGYVEAARIISGLDAIVEVDAHCRQKEICSIGAGQSLLFNMPALHGILRALRNEAGARTILKFRGNVVSERAIVNSLGRDCDILHVDAMQKGVDLPDLGVFDSIPDGAFLIGNNSVRDAATAQTVLEYCDAFSFARIADDAGAVQAMLDAI